MKSQLSIGRVLAFFLGILLVFLLWGQFFTPGGIGANIILGLAVAVFAVYMMTTSVGPYLDDFFFHGGSRERALALRHAEQRGREIATKLESIKNRRKKNENNAKEVEACSAALNELFSTITQVRSHPAIDPKIVAADIKKVTDLEGKAQSTITALLGKPLVSHGIFSGWASLVSALAAAIALRMFIIEPYQIPSGSMIPTLLVGDHLFVSKLRYGIMNPFSKEPSYLIRWATPVPGEVIVFQAPPYVGRNAGETWIKRIIAGPGQSVRLSDTVVYVDGKAYRHLTPGENVRYKDYDSAGEQGRFFGEGDIGVWRERDAIHNIEEIGDIKHDIFDRPEPQRIRQEIKWPGLFGGPFPGLDCEVDVCRVREGHVLVMGDNRGYSSDGRFWGALPIENIKGKALFIWMSVDGSTSSIDLGRFSLPGFRWERWFRAIS